MKYSRVKLEANLSELQRNIGDFDVQNILVSSCLLGERVRYDGLVLRVSSRVIDALKQVANIIPFCPEVTGGLPVPRLSSEISGGDGNLVLDGKAVVNDIKGNDGTFTKMLKSGRGVTAALLEKHEIHVFSENEIEKAITFIIKINEDF